MGLVGTKRVPISLTFPYGTRIDTQAPILVRPHEKRATWLWVDAPGLVAPVLGCPALPRRLPVDDLADVAMELGHSPTLIKLAMDHNKDLGARAAGLSLQWLRAAADLGDWRAHNNLGVMYELGRGVPKDRDKALAHYRAAAGPTHLIATQNLMALQAEITLGIKVPGHSPRETRID